MTEVPEHLLKRAQAARDKAKTEAPADAGGGDAAPAGDSRIPAHLLERSKAAKAKQAGGGSRARRRRQGRLGHDRRPRFSEGPA